MDFLRTYLQTAFLQTSLLSRTTLSELIVPTVLKIGVWSCCLACVWSHSALCTGECRGWGKGLVIKGLIVEALRIIGFRGLQGKLAAFSTSVWGWVQVRTSGVGYWMNLGLFSIQSTRWLLESYPSTTNKCNTTCGQHISHPLKTRDINAEDTNYSLVHWEPHHTAKIVFQLLI